MLLGFPTGSRLQVPVVRSDGLALAVEGFAGFEPIANTAVFAAGGRVLNTSITGRHGNAFICNPGLDLYYCRRRYGGGGYFISPALEIGCLHDFHDHFGWDVGLDIGIGVGGDSGRFNRVLPTISLFTGFSF